MAGFRDFQTGEVLTAENVNDFLMQQTVMKFADAAARDTALGTAVGGGNALREGMVAYLDSTDEVIRYDGTAWSALGAAGIGTNVVQAVKTDTFTTSSVTLSTVTGVSATITPTSATSKILVLVSGTYAVTAARSARFVLDRGGTSIALSTGSASFESTQHLYPNDADAGDSFSFTFLDSPATTSATTYSLQAALNFLTGTVSVGRIGANDNRSITTITVIEVAA